MLFQNVREISEIVIKMEYIKCPFCNENDFDLLGLKIHLVNYCEEYDKIDTRRNISTLYIKDSNKIESEELDLNFGGTPHTDSELKRVTKLLDKETKKV